MRSLHRHESRGKSSSSTEESNSSSSGCSSRMDKINTYIKENLDIKLELHKELGVGGFGIVYSATWKDNETVAVKVEPVKNFNSLIDEVKIYNHIHGTTGYLGLPQCLYYHSGSKSKEDSFRILVLPMLGKNLDDLLVQCRQKVFSPCTTMVIAYQILAHLKHIHSMGVVHRDVKPGNMVTLSNHGCGKSLVTLLDFGLSRHYKNPNGSHIKAKRKDIIRGTVRFMGIHTHEACEVSRRDDFQCLAYSLIYFLKGRLPWQGLSKKTKMSEVTKRERIYRAKKSMSSTELCKDLPPIFEKFLKYSLSLRFDETPNYDSWRRMFYENIKQEFGDIKYELDF